MTAEATWEQETPMSWEAYEALGDDAPGEYLDGKLVVSPRPSFQHQHAVHELVSLLKGAYPDQRVLAEAAWKPALDEFSPDVMVIPRTDETVRFTGTPVLVVEVLSTNRVHDLVRKVAKYAAVGLPHYWVLDPVERELHDFELRAGVFERVALVRGSGRTHLLPELEISVESLLDL